jgi:transcriptional regulator with XRE-family HTH domain
MIGLTQKEMANLLNCSCPTIQAIELGKLKMSERLAQETNQKTGVSLNWLLKADPQAPPVGEINEPYSVTIFEQTQANLTRKFTDETDPDFSSEFLAWCLWGTASMMLAAIQEDRHVLFKYKMRRNLEALEEEFGGWPALDEDASIEINCAMSENPPYFQSFFEKIHKEIMKLFKAKSREASSVRSGGDKPIPARSGAKPPHSGAGNHPADAKKSPSRISAKSGPRKNPNRTKK